MIIYSDSQIIDIDWLPKIGLTQPYHLCHSFEEYVASPIQPKIAFTTHRLHCDHDINCQAYQGFEDKINQLSEHSLLVFSFESELHNFHWEIWDKCHHDNVYWVVPGAINDNEDINSHIIFWGDWFKTTTQLYKDLPHKLAEIKTFETKPMMFDALLGSPKPHRDHVFNSVKQYGLQDKFIIPYGGQWNDNQFYAKDYFIWEEGTELIGEQQPGTAGWANYHGELTSLSKIIPIKVFNDTAYSIIAETDHDNTLSFYSEKTAKPMIARRLFIAFTGYKFLHNLREQGFKTFDGIIDESYDQIFDDTERYTAAFEQARWLCEQDQQVIYEKIKPIVEYNFNHIMNTDWTDWGAKKIEKVIKSVL